MLGIILAIVGITLLIYGGLITFGFIKTDVSKDAELDKKLISEKDRYRWSRYSAGIQFMLGGVVLAFLGLVSYFA